MALTNNTRQFNGNLIFLDAYSKDKDGNRVKSHFSVSRVGADGKIARTEETIPAITGSLFKIDIKMRETKGGPSKKVILYVRDGEESYAVNLTFRMSTRSLFNCLASLETYNNLAIEIYDNKRGYESFSLQQNGNKVDWKHKLEEQPEPVEVMFKGKPMRDYTPVDDMFEAELQAIAKKLGGGKSEAPASAAKPAAAPQKETSVAATKGAKAPASEEDDGSVPF